MYISASCMDAQRRPTCCAALPGDRGQVRVNIEDPVRHLSLRQPNRLVSGRELVGKFPIEYHVWVVTLPWKL